LVTSLLVAGKYEQKVYVLFIYIGECCPTLIIIKQFNLFYAAHISLLFLWFQHLHHASWWGYQDCIEELLAAGADWRARNSISLGSQTPEDMAVWRGNALSWNFAFDKARKRVSEECQRNERENTACSPEEECARELIDLLAGWTKDVTMETAIRPQISTTQATQGVSAASNYKIQAVFAMKRSVLSVALLIVLIAFLSHALL
jgi:hypothetical protein